MTEDQIERIVQSRTDSIDRAYMAGRIDEETYNLKMRALARWADRALARERI